MFSLVSKFGTVTNGAMRVVNTGGFIAFEKINKMCLF